MAKAAAKKTPIAATATALTVPQKSDPNILELAGGAATQLEVAKVYTIDSREMYDIATVTLSEIREAEKKAETLRKSVADPLHKAWKNTNALFNPILDQLADAKRVLGGKMIQFENAERARVQAAEQAAAAQRERDMAATEAKLHEVTKDFEEGRASVEELQAAATDALVAETAMPVAPTEDKLHRGGHARIERWTVAEITSVPALLRYLADRLESGDPTFDNTVDFKLGQLNAFAQSTSGSVAVPGVRFEKQQTLSARA